MVTVKGILLGLVLFFIGSVLYVGNKLRPIEEHKATGISAITAVTVRNPWYWIGLIVALVVGCAIVWFWRRPSVVS